MKNRTVEEMLGTRRMDRIHFYGMLVFVIAPIVAWALKPYLHF